MITPRTDVAKLAPYALADLSVPEGVPLISLAQNESALPPSPLAIAAGQAALSDAALYPDPEWTDLRASISDVHGVSADAILCGSGSMELIWAIFQAFAGPGNNVLSTAHAYALFQTATRASGAVYRTAPEPGLSVCVDALLDATDRSTRIVAVANPGNPTGTRIPNLEIRRLRSGLPNDVLLVVDEAYGEFADHLDTPLFDLADRGDTVVLRTFSKAYGLAGQRIGWGVFPPTVGTQVRKLMNPNNVNAVSQAMAAAAMTDQAYMRQTVRHTTEMRDRFCADLAKLNLAGPQSQTNFALIPFADPGEAGEVDQALRKVGLLMRGMAGYGLGHCLRATIAAEGAMEAAIAVLTAWRGRQR